MFNPSSIYIYIYIYEYVQVPYHPLKTPSNTLMIPVTAVCIFDCTISNLNISFVTFHSYLELKTIVINVFLGEYRLVGPTQISKLIYGGAAAACNRLKLLI